MSAYRYPWPASALTPADMAVLHAVRESSHPRVRITDLVAHAVRQTYGRKAQPTLKILPTQPNPKPLKEAA